MYNKWDSDLMLNIFVIVRISRFFYLLIMIVLYYVVLICVYWKCVVVFEVWEKINMDYRGLCWKKIYLKKWVFGKKNNKWDVILDVVLFY